MRVGYYRNEEMDTSSPKHGALCKHCALTNHAKNTRKLFAKHWRKNICANRLNFLRNGGFSGGARLTR